MLEAETWPPQEVKLTPGKRVLFLTKDLDLVRKQLYEGLDLRMEDISIDELLDRSVVLNTRLEALERRARNLVALENAKPSAKADRDDKTTE